VIDDSLVVVGQPTRHQKKRKMVKAKTIAPQDGQGEEEIEEFDYSTALNILDANPKGAAEVVSRKKRRSESFSFCDYVAEYLFFFEGEGGTQYRNFPAPPKANSQPKSGNQSHTFS
jgi:exosome complex exonuclease RRP6